MCVALFYSLVKVHHSNLENLILYFGNGSQYLLR